MALYPPVRRFEAQLESQRQSFQAHWDLQLHMGASHQLFSFERLTIGLA